MKKYSFENTEVQKQTNKKTTEWQKKIKVIAWEEGSWGVWRGACLVTQAASFSGGSWGAWQEHQRLRGAGNKLEACLISFLSYFSLFLSISNLQMFLPCSLSYHLHLWTILLSGLSAFLSLSLAPLWHSPFISVKFLPFFLQITFFYISLLPYLFPQLLLAMR